MDCGAAVWLRYEELSPFKLILWTFFVLWKVYSSKNYNVQCLAFIQRGTNFGLINKQLIKVNTILSGLLLCHQRRNLPNNLNNCFIILKNTENEMLIELITAKILSLDNLGRSIIMYTSRIMCELANSRY